MPRLKALRKCFWVQPRKIVVMIYNEKATFFVLIQTAQTNPVATRYCVVFACELGASEESV